MLFSIDAALSNLVADRMLGAGHAEQMGYKVLLLISGFNPKGVSLMCKWIPSLKLSPSSSLHIVLERAAVWVGGGRDTHRDYIDLRGHHMANSIQYTGERAASKKGFLDGAGLDAGSDCEQGAMFQTLGIVCA